MANWPSNARQQMCQWSRPSDFIGDQRNILQNEKFLFKWKWSKLWPWELKPTSERLLPWLLEREEVKVLHLVRDPRYIYFSNRFLFGFALSSPIRDPRYFFFLDLCFSAFFTNHQFYCQGPVHIKTRAKGKYKSSSRAQEQHISCHNFCSLNASHCHENMI